MGQVAQGRELKVAFFGLVQDPAWQERTICQVAPSTMHGVLVVFLFSKDTFAEDQESDCEGNSLRGPILTILETAPCKPGS